MPDPTVETAEVQADKSMFDNVSSWFKRTAVDVMDWAENFEAEHPEMVEKIKTGLLLTIPLTMPLGASRLTTTLAANQAAETTQPTTQPTTTTSQTTVPPQATTTGNAGTTNANTGGQAPASTDNGNAQSASGTSGEAARTVDVNRTVFVPTGPQVTGAENQARVQTIENAFPAIQALIKATITDLEGKGNLTQAEQSALNTLKSIPERLTQEADGYLDANEVEIIDKLSDALRTTILSDPDNADLLAGDQNSKGFTEQLGKTVNRGLDGQLQKLLDDPSKSNIHPQLRYFKENRLQIVGALRGLEKDGLLVGTAGTHNVQTVAVPADANGQPVMGQQNTNTTPSTTNTDPSGNGGAQAQPRNADELNLTTAIYDDGVHTADEIREAVEAIELVQVKAHKALNDMSPFFADLMDKPNADGNLDGGEKRNLAAMVMLMKKINGESNPNGVYDEAKLVELREALLTDDKFEMLRQQLKELGIQKINQNDSEEIKAQKRRDADNALFRHLLVLEKQGMTDPNAASVTAANLAFDKIREFLPEGIKNMLRGFLEGTGIGRMVMGVAAAKGMNLERLWKEPDPEVIEADVLQERRSTLLAKELETYLEKAEAQLKDQGNANPQFADVLALAKQNITNDIDNNKFNRVGKLVLGDEYDNLRNDLKNAVAATQGTTIEEAKASLVTEVGKLNGANLDATVTTNIPEVREQVNQYSAGNDNVFSQAGAPPPTPADASNNATTNPASVVTTPAQNNPVTPSTATTATQNVAVTPSTATTTSTLAATAAPTGVNGAIPQVERDSVDPATVSTLGAGDNKKEVVLQYDRDPNKYVVLNVPSNGRVKAILEAISSMDADKRPYDPEDLIRRTKGSNEIIDLAYKFHNGAFEKLAIAAQLDDMISKGQTTIRTSDLVHPITKENLPQIENFLRKNGADEAKITAAMIAANSLIDQQVRGKSVMATQFGNWDQIRIADIRALVEEIEPNTEITVVDVPTPTPAPVLPAPEPVTPPPPVVEREPFRARGFGFDPADGNFNLQYGLLPQVPRPESNLQKTFAFESGPISSPMPCTRGSAIMAGVTAGNNYRTGSECYATPDMPGYREAGANRPWMNVKLERDPDDPYGKGTVVPKYTPLGGTVGASDFDFRVDTSKDGEAKREDVKRANAMFGDTGGDGFHVSDVLHFRRIKARSAEPDAGARELSREIINTYYEYRGKLDDAGLLSKRDFETYTKSVSYTDALDRAATQQMAILQNSLLTREQQVAKIHEIRDQIDQYYKRVSGAQPQRIIVNKEDLFESTVQGNATAIAAEIERKFSADPELKELALEALQGFERDADRVLGSKDSVEEARTKIEGQGGLLSQLDAKLDAIDSIKNMAGTQILSAYKNAITGENVIGQDNDYSKQALAKVATFDEKVDDILNGRGSIDDKLARITQEQNKLQTDINKIFYDKQKNDYDIAYNAADMGLNQVDPSTLENNPELAAERQLAMNAGATGR